MKVLNKSKGFFREQEALYRGMFESAGTALCLIDEELLIHLVNPAFERLFGLPRRKVEKKLAWFYFIPEADRERVREFHFSEASSIEYPDNRYEVQIVDKMGSIRDVLVLVANLKGTTRKILSIFEVTQNRRVQKALAYRLSFEQIISAISRGFVNVAPGMLHDEIREALERIGRFAKSDRSFIFLIDRKEKVIRHAYQWNAPGIEPQSETIRETPLPKIEWALDMLNESGRLHIHDPQSLPEEAGFIRDTLVSEGVKSTAVVPMRHAGEVRGLLGFDAVTAKRFWREDDFFLLETTVDIITKALIHEDFQRMLAESEQRFRKIFQQGPLAMAVVDTEYRVTAVNPMICTLTGYGAEELKGRRLTELTHEEGRGRSEATEKKLLSGSIPYYTMEERLVKRNGESLWVYWTTFSIRDENQEPLYGVEIFEDITERKYAVEALRKSEQKYRDFADFLPQAVFEADLKGILTYTNQHAFDLFGYSREDFVRGLAIYGMIHPSDRERAESNVAAIFEGARSKGEEYRAMRKNGEFFPVLIYSAPIWEKERPLGIRGIIIDISSRKELETRLAQSQKMEAIGRLAGGIAHDFNNILTVILGHGSLLAANESLSEEIREELGDIIDASRSGAALTRQLLAFSRKQIVQMEILDLNELIQSSRKMLRRLINEDINFSVELNPEIGNIRADSGQIEQIIMNLVINASDAMPEGGNLTLRTFMRTVGAETAEQYENAEAGSYVVLEVADTGRGMDYRTRERIMEPFFTTKKDREGTGLGLSTVYGIVKQLDGFLTVTSKIDEGSTFSVFLPETKSERPEKLGESTVSETGKESLLLVEDEEELRNVAGRMLESQGYTVQVAADGREALKLLAEGARIELVITDVVMPGMNGRELAEDIEKNFPGKKILFISGYTDDSVIQHGVSERRINFLHKPFSKKELHRKVRELLDD